MPKKQTNALHFILLKPFFDPITSCQASKFRECFPPHSQRENVLFNDFQGALYTQRPKNPAKIMPKLAGQGDLLETRNWPLLLSKCLKRGSNNSPFKVEVCCSKDGLKF